MRGSRRAGASRAASSPCGVNIHLCGLTTSESARSTPCEGPAELRADHRRAGVGGVDVQPDAGALAARRRSRRPGRPTSSRSSRRWRRPRARVVEVERVRRASGSSSSTGTLRSSSAEHPRGLVDRGVRVLGADDDAARRSRRARGDRARPASRSRRCPRCGRASPPAARAAARPSRARAPRARSSAGDVRQRIADLCSAPPRATRRGSPAPTPVVGEVGEEARVLPVRDPRQQHLVEVAQHGRERLALLGRRLRAAAPGCRPARPARAPAARRRARGSRPPSRAAASAVLAEASLLDLRPRAACSRPAPSSATRGGPARSRGAGSPVRAVECASVETTIRTPASPARRASASRRSSRSAGS